MKRIFTAWCAGTIMLLTPFSVTGTESVIPPVSWDFQTAPEDITIVNNEDGSPTFGYVNWKRSLVYETSYGDSPASDMLVLPAMQLKAGKRYGITYSAYASWYRFEWDPTLKWVIAPSAGQLAQGETIGEPVAFTSSYDPEEHSFTFEVDADGTYVLAALLNAGEPQGSGSFYMCAVALDGGVSLNAPSAPGLSVNPAIREGSLKMDISITAPQKTMSGAAIDGSMTYSLTNSTGRFSLTGDISAGQTIIITDDGCDPNGETYTAFVALGEETGQAATASCTPEYDRPAAPCNVTTSLQDDGTVTVAWDPVTEGKNGGLFNPATVVYSVQRSDRHTVATKISGTSVTDIPVIPDEGQAAYSYTVSAYGDPMSYYYSSADSDEIILGHPYQGKLSESFDNGNASTSIWSYGPAGTSYSAWSPTTSSYSNPSCMADSDGTGGFLLFNPSYSDGVEYISPVIDMTGAMNPRVSLDIYRYASAPEQPLVSLWVESDGMRTPVEEGSLAFKAETDGWASVGFPLPAAVAENEFRLVLSGTKVNGQAYKAIIDNILVRDVKAFDAAIEAIDMENALMPGQTCEVSASVVNNGSEALESVYVSINIGSGEAYRSEPFNLASGQKDTLAMPLYISPFHSGTEQDITVTVHAGGDLDPANDSMTASAAVGTHPLPHASLLSAVHTGSGALLSWSAPEIPTEPVSAAVAESFEGWSPGSTKAMDDWKFIDSDGKDKYGLADVNKDEKFAFFVTDKFSSSAAASLTAADGVKALVTTRASDYSDIDVWLVSPAIDPSAAVSFQTTGIGFRGADAASFEFGYIPAGSESTADFVKTDDVETSGYSWETFKKTLPAGAGRFAIHVTAVNSYGVAFDDFRFNALMAPPELKEYKLWRNREHVTSLTPGCTSWVDHDADRTVDNLYHISCVYNPDKETMDNEGLVLAAGNVPDSMDGIATETGWSLDGNVLTAKEHMEVLDLRGIKIAGAQPSDRIVLEPGLYVIKGKTNHSKIIVK